MIKKTLFLLKRKWLIRKLKRHWHDEQVLRRAAVKKGWSGILEVFHCERTYQEIKREAYRFTRH